jgi:hypothetical protein
VQLAAAKRCASALLHCYGQGGDSRQSNYTMRRCSIAADNYCPITGRLKTQLSTRMTPVNSQPSSPSLFSRSARKALVCGPSLPSTWRNSSLRRTRYSHAGIPAGFFAAPISNREPSPRLTAHPKTIKNRCIGRRHFPFGLSEEPITTQSRQDCRNAPKRVKERVGYSRRSVEASQYMLIV